MHNVEDYHGGDTVVMDQEIGLQKFISSTHNKLDMFAKYWGNKHVEDPENHPINLSEYEFCNQFTVFCVNILPELM